MKSPARAYWCPLSARYDRWSMTSLPEALYLRKFPRTLKRTVLKKTWELFSWDGEEICFSILRVKTSKDSGAIKYIWHKFHFFFKLVYLSDAKLKWVTA